MATLSYTYLYLSIAALLGFFVGAFLSAFLGIAYSQGTSDEKRGCIPAFAAFGILAFVGFILTPSYSPWGPSTNEEPSRTPIDDFTNGIYTRRAREPKDMAFGAWAVL